MEVGDKIKSGPWEGFELISKYTREQAIDDGELIDVSEAALTFGFRVPVALTCGVWAELPEEKSDSLTSLLQGLFDAIRNTGEPSDKIHFVIELNGGILSLWAHIGPGDDEKPVMTIMLKGED